MLQIAGLSVSYGGVLTALRDIDLEVPRGGIVALLGSNGAGKTTLLRAISRNLKRHQGRVTSGTITFGGHDLATVKTPAVTARGLVQVPEGRRIFGRLTVEENLRIGGLRRSRSEAATSRALVYELFPRLAERSGQRGLLLSGGEQQMLAIGRAMMAGPKLLMLDEPSLGLAPLVVDQVARVINTINEAGTSILLIEQNANMALSIADHAYVLDLGRVSLQGSAASLLGSNEVRHLYLGHGGGAAATAAAENAAAARVDELSHKTLSRWEQR